MKKKRSLLRRLVTWWIRGVAIAAVATFIVGWPAVNTQPGLTRDWVAEMNALKVSMEPEGEAAWPIYRDIIVNDFGISSVEDEDCTALRTLLNELALNKKHPGMRDSGWQEAIFDPHRELLDSSKIIFEKLDLATARPRFGKDYVRKGSPLEGEQDPNAPVMGLFLYMPELGELRRLSQLNGLRARRAAEQSDWDEFSRSIESGLALGAHAGRAGTLIEELVGVSIAVVPVLMLQAELTDKEIPADACVRIDELMERTLHVRDWCSNTLDIELMSIASSLEAFYGTNGYSGAGLWEYDGETRAFVSHANWWRRLFNAYAIFVATKQDCIDAFTPAFEGVREGLVVDASEFQSFGERFDQSFDAEESLPIMVNILMPAVGRVLRNNIMFERDICATRIMLLLESIHAETGEWPATLDAPELAELNECSLTGKPFIYALTPDDPHGRAYTLQAPETIWDNIGGEDYTKPRPVFEPAEPDDDSLF